MLLKHIKNQYGFAPLLLILILLVVGTVIGVASLRNGTNFLPSANIKDANIQAPQGYFLSIRNPAPFFTNLDVPALPPMDDLPGNNPPPISDASSSARLPLPDSKGIAGNYTPGDEVAITVSVASDQVNSTNFQTTINYPNDLLEFSKIITTSQGKGRSKSSLKTVECKSDKDCRSTEFCNRTLCAANNPNCKKTPSFCTSKEELTCASDSTCGTGLYCDKTVVTQDGLGSCKIKQEEIKEGASCKKTADCVNGLICVQSMINNRENGTCQRATQENYGEIQCQTDNDCTKGSSCLEAQGGTCNRGEDDQSNCTGSIVVQGTYCSPIIATAPVETYSTESSSITYRGAGNFACQSDTDCPADKPSCQKQYHSSCPNCDDMILTGSICAVGSQNENLTNIDSRKPIGENCSSDTECQSGLICGTQPCPSGAYCKQDISAPTCQKPSKDIKNHSIDIQSLRNFFITKWTQIQTDQATGQIKLAGSVASPGLRTNQFPDRPIMAVIMFKTKKTGVANIQVADASMSSSEGTPAAEIEKGNVQLTINGQKMDPQNYPATNEDGNKSSSSLRNLIYRFVKGWN